MSFDSIFDFLPGYQVSHGPIKYLLILFLILVLLATLRIQPGQRTLALRRLALLGFLAFAFVAVLFPQFVTSVANAVGVGRGTDLLLYLLVVVVFANMASSYRRRAEIDQKIVGLSRALAKQNPFPPGTLRTEDISELTYLADSVDPATPLKPNSAIEPEDFPPPTAPKEEATQFPPVAD